MQVISQANASGGSIKGKAVKSIEDIETAEEAAQWLRTERRRRGWTAEKLADLIRAAALEEGESLTLTRQAISQMETGRTLSIPRWLKYFDVVLLNDTMARARTGGDFGQREETTLGTLRVFDLDEDEATLIERWRLLGMVERQAVVRLVTDLSSAAWSKVDQERRRRLAGLHDKSQGYRPK